jgi:hypothetical protein
VVEVPDKRAKTQRLHTPDDFDAEATLVKAPSFVVEPRTEPSVHVEVVREQADDAKVGATGWRAFEVWTKNRVYGLDTAMMCIQVLDRSTGRIDADHKLLGYRLGGGRLRDGSATRYAYPFPLAGMDGMFTRSGRSAFTSRIERLVVRIRELHATTDIEPARWDDLVGHGANRGHQP